MEQSRFKGKKPNKKSTILCADLDKCQRTAEIPNVNPVSDAASDLEAILRFENEGGLIPTKNRL